MINDAYLYGKRYFMTHYLADAKRDEMQSQEYHRLSKHLPLNGSLLDVGCGVGNFTSLFTHWKKYAVEPSDYASSIAKDKGIKMFSRIEDVHLKSYLSLVIFRGTIQHISNPMTVITKATRMLSLGGVIAFLATPNTNSLVYKVWGDLPPLDKEKNWVLFNDLYLQNILIRLGYEIIEVNYPYWGTPYAKPLFDFINFFTSLIFGYRKFAFPGSMMEIIARKIGE